VFRIETLDRDAAPVAETHTLRAARRACEVLTTEGYNDLTIVTPDGTDLEAAWRDTDGTFVLELSTLSRRWENVYSRRAA
jgi:hypothetical protein